MPLNDLNGKEFSKTREKNKKCCGFICWLPESMLIIIYYTQSKPQQRSSGNYKNSGSHSIWDRLRCSPYQQQNQKMLTFESKQFLLGIAKKIHLQYETMCDRDAHRISFASQIRCVKWQKWFVQSTAIPFNDNVQIKSSARKHTWTMNALLSICEFDDDKWLAQFLLVCRLPFLFLWMEPKCISPTKQIH